MKTKVLFVLGSMEIGGVQSGIMNFAKFTPSDQIQFDVLVQSKTKGYHEEEFKKYGNVYRIPVLRTNSGLLNIFLSLPSDLIWRIRLNSFLKRHGDYGAVHSKLLNGVADTMEISKKRGIPVRVAHSHVDKPKNLNAFYRWYYRRSAKRIEKSATVKLAVSPGASDLLFDKYGSRVIKNPTISLKRLDPKKYNPEPHDELRLIQIGTFSRRKNQIFSVEILKHLIDSGVKARLTLIGYPLDEPDYPDMIKKRVDECGLSDKVSFLPKDSDVPKELSESDFMLIPSLREGLPNVALESQAMGVPCFVSDTVNSDTDCGLCTFLSLSDGAEKLAQAILSYRSEHGTEKTYIDMSEWDNVNICREYVKIRRNI